MQTTSIERVLCVKSIFIFLFFYFCVSKYYVIKKSGQISYLSKSKRVFLLATVYLFLLTSFMLPHHHHEEVVCYTKTHCETETDNHSGNYHDFTDHSHDHSSGEESQTCLSLEYYVKSDFNKSSKNPLSHRLIRYANSNFSPLFSNHHLQEDIRTKEFPFKFITEYSFYSVFMKHELSLRGPPSIIV